MTLMILKHRFPAIFAMLFNRGWTEAKAFLSSLQSSSKAFTSNSFGRSRKVVWKINLNSSHMPWDIWRGSCLLCNFSCRTQNDLENGIAYLLILPNDPIDHNIFAYRTSETFYLTVNVVDPKIPRAVHEQNDFKNPRWIKMEIFCLERC